MYCVYHGLSDFGHLEKATLKTHETNLSECSMGGSLKSPELSETSWVERSNGGSMARQRWSCLLSRPLGWSCALLGYTHYNALLLYTMIIFDLCTICLYVSEVYKYVYICTGAYLFVCRRLKKSTKVCNKNHSIPKANTIVRDMSLKRMADTCR